MSETISRPAGRPRRIDPAVAAGAGDVAEDAHTERAPVRPPLRAEMREDSRARAKRRTAEITANGGLDIDTVDKFFIDKSRVPDGWDYEWKRDATFGKEDPSYMSALLMTGWEPVPTEDMPELMPGMKEPAIRRDGMILMQRPKEISEAARAKEYQRARGQVRAKEAQNGMAGDGEGPRLAPTINKNYAHIPIPDDE